MNSTLIALCYRYIKENFNLFFNFLRLNYFLLIAFQLTFVTIDRYQCLFIISNFKSTKYSYTLTTLLLITLITAYIIYKSRAILILLVVIFLEAIGHYSLKGSVHTGYITHFIALLYLLYISTSDVYKNIYISLINKINIKHLFLMAIILYLFMYLVYGGFNGHSGRSIGNDIINVWFFTGSDQSSYYKMILKIVNGEWFYGGYRGDFLYPLGYPLLGSLGYFIYKDNPFFLINIIVYVTMLITIYYSVNRYTNKVFALSAFFILAMQTPILNINDWFMKSMILPFNNIVSFLASSVILYYLFIDRKLNKKELFLVSFVISLVLLSRYGDVIFFVFPLAYLVFRKSSVNIYKSMLISGIPLLITVLGILYTHNLFYGDPFTTYHNFTGKHEFWFHPFAFDVSFYKFIEMFFFPFMSDNSNYSSFLLSMAYVIFLPFGVYYLWKEKRKKIEVILILVVMFTNIWYFTSADAVNSVNIRFDAFRYFGVSVPIIIFLSFVGIYYLVVINNKLLEINNKLKVGLIVLLLLIFSEKSDVKDYIYSLVKFDYNVEFIGLKDTVKDAPYVNYGEDGIKDIQFEVKINSIIPVHLMYASIVDPNGKEYLSQEHYKKSELKGIGIVNEYGYNVKLGWGDNNYKHNYLHDEKKIVLTIPNSKNSQIVYGEYKFTIGTSKEKIYKNIILKKENE